MLKRSCLGADIVLIGQKQFWLVQLRVEVPVRGSGVLTAGRHVDIEAQTVLALIGQEWDQSAQLQVAILGHEPQRGRHIADVWVALRTDGRQRVGQPRAVPAGRGCWWLQAPGGCGVRHTQEHLHRLQVPGVQFLNYLEQGTINRNLRL